MGLGNLSDKQMEYQLLDRTSYRSFCLLQDAMNVPDRNTIWRFGEPLGVEGPRLCSKGDGCPVAPPRLYELPRVSGGCLVSVPMSLQPIA